MIKEKNDYEFASTDFNWSRNSSGQKYSWEEFKQLAEGFHGYAAPGLIIGGKIVGIALSNIPENILFDAICETNFCLPDAVQILTPCTTGNGWMKVVNLGKFAVILYDKTNGHGVRVFLDPAKLEDWPEITTWFYKLKPKKEQDSKRLYWEIGQAGSSIYSFKKIIVKEKFLKKRSLGKTVNCKICGEAYPEKHGKICRGCQGEDRFFIPGEDDEIKLQAISTADAVGKKILHDMTMVIPDEKKGPAFRKGQTITPQDMCRLHKIGRNNIYVDDDININDDDFIHENDAALAFAEKMAGTNISYTQNPSEGKVTFNALKDGLLVFDEEKLETFNLVPDVMCASRKNRSLVLKDRPIAGTRAIPLYLSKKHLRGALKVLEDAPLFEIKELKKAKIGILVTGTEVFKGLIKDGFKKIITSKIDAFGCELVRSAIVPDDKEAITNEIKSLIQEGIDILITTAGLSVDPDDVTRKGLVEAGAENILYGAPFLPGAMSLIADINDVKVIGVPACALYFKTTGFDVVLPQILAGIDITRKDLSKLGNGGFCLNCKVCSFPKCSFGK